MARPRQPPRPRSRRPALAAGGVGAAVAAALAVEVGASGTGQEFRLQLLPDGLARERGAQCLDHSPAGFYIREQDPARWVVFLEGGGLCVEPADCAYRAAKTARGSSRFWRPERTPEDNHMLTADSPLNPFANWSHVYVPYCSGDTWLGSSKEGHSVLLGLQMSGHLILETVVERLANTTGIIHATDVILSGTSAGGIGTFHHADWFAEKLADLAASAGAAVSPRVAGVAVEGVFFPEGFPVLYPEFWMGIRKPVDGVTSKYIVSFFSPTFLHQGCVAAAKLQGFEFQKCFDVSVMFKFIKTPMFVITNLFDKLMIQDLGMCKDCSARSKPGTKQGKYARFFGRLMEKTANDFHLAQPAAGIFATSEFHHDENFVDFFSSREKKIAGESLGSAIGRWYWKKEPVFLLEPWCGGEAGGHDVGGPCPDGGDDAAAVAAGPLFA